MIKELSVLIPVYNDDATKLVHSLYIQAQSIEGLRFEIVVYDDGSTNEDIIAANKSLELMSGCRYVRSGHHSCRAAMRNAMFLCGKYQWHLMVDARLTPKYDNFLLRYLCCDVDNDGCVCGGVEVFGGKHEKRLCKENLRFRYEKYEERNHSLSQRQKQPYQSFRTTNFFYNRLVLDRVPYDESIKGYGYEDVMLGKAFNESQIQVVHIDNPVIYSDFESNEVYLRKVNEALKTLYAFSDSLKDYSPLLRLVSVLEKWHLLPAIRNFHQVLSKIEVANLCGNSPSLLVLKLYKIGYYISL